MKQKKGGGSRKLGRNKKECEAYRNSGRRDVNRCVGLLNHFYRNSWWHGDGQPDIRLIADNSARAAYDSIGTKAQTEGLRAWKRARRQ